MQTYPFKMTDAAVCKIIDAAPFGFGSSRQVYGVINDPLVVVKEMIGTFPGTNIMEWFIWNWADDQPDEGLSSILAKCRSISETGKYLLMERLADLDKSDYGHIPKIPRWLNDVKPSAFGKVNGKIKIRDYSMIIGASILSSETKPPPIFEW